MSGVTCHAYCTIASHAFFDACRLPASALEQVEVNPVTGVQVVVNGSFTPSSFTAINSGVATLQVKGISTKTAKLQNSG